MVMAEGESGFWWWRMSHFCLLDVFWHKIVVLCVREADNVRLCAT